MRELVRTNDAVLVSAVAALLDGAAIPHLVFDQNMSVLEGSIGILPRRVLVAEDAPAAAAGSTWKRRGSSTSCGPMHAEARMMQESLMESLGALTEDAVLGGALRLRQPRRGHRVGHDIAVLLAAAWPRACREHVVDLGAGVGAAGLALAARAPDIAVTLVEVDPGLRGARRRKCRARGWAARVKSLTLDAAAPASAFTAAGASTRARQPEC